MAKVTIYDENGNAIEREPVDARECIDSGSYFAQPPKAENAPPADDGSDANVADSGTIDDGSDAGVADGDTAIEADKSKKAK
jgi:hypothetical protein